MFVYKRKYQITEINWINVAVYWGKNHHNMKREIWGESGREREGGSGRKVHWKLYRLKMMVVSGNYNSCYTSINWYERFGPLFELVVSTHSGYLYCIVKWSNSKVKLMPLWFVTPVVHFSHYLFIYICVYELTVPFLFTWKIHFLRRIFSFGYWFYDFRLNL